MPIKKTDKATWWGLIVALLLPQLLFLLPKSWNQLTRIILNEVVFWTLTAVLLLFIMKKEKLPLSSIGLRKPNWRTILFGLLAFLLLLFTLGLISKIQHILGISGYDSGMNKISAYPLWLRLMLVLRASVVEEILYRGYPIERITAITGSIRIGAVIPLIVFTLLHWSFWGMSHLLFVVGAALILTLFYVWKRNLTILIIAHFLMNFMGAILAPILPHLPGK